MGPSLFVFSFFFLFPGVVLWETPVFPYYCYISFFIEKNKEEKGCFKIDFFFFVFCYKKCIDNYICFYLPKLWTFLCLGSGPFLDYPLSSGEREGVRGRECGVD